MTRVCPGCCCPRSWDHFNAGRGKRPHERCRLCRARGRFRAAEKELALAVACISREEREHQQARELSERIAP